MTAGSDGRIPCQTNDPSRSSSVPRGSRCALSTTKPTRCRRRPPGADRGGYGASPRRRSHAFPGTRVPRVAAYAARRTAGRSRARRAAQEPTGGRGPRSRHRRPRARRPRRRPAVPPDTTTRSSSPAQRSETTPEPGIGSSRARAEREQGSGGWSRTSCVERGERRRDGSSATETRPRVAAPTARADRPSSRARRPGLRTSDWPRLKRNGVRNDSVRNGAPARRDGSTNRTSRPPRATRPRPAGRPFHPDQLRGLGAHTGARARDRAANHDAGSCTHHGCSRMPKSSATTEAALYPAASQESAGGQTAFDR